MLVAVCVCVCWRWRAPFPGSLLFLSYVIYALRSVSFDSFRCGGTEQKLTQIDDDDGGRNGGNAIVPPFPLRPCLWQQKNAGTATATLTAAETAAFAN